MFRYNNVYHPLLMFCRYQFVFCSAVSVSKDRCPLAKYWFSGRDNRSHWPPGRTPTNSSKDFRVQRLGGKPPLKEGGMLTRTLTARHLKQWLGGNGVNDKRASVILPTHGPTDDLARGDWLKL